MAPTDIELEKGIRGTKLRGSIDALYQDIVFEFRRHLKLERKKGKEELKRYLRSLGDKQVFFGVLTDRLVFEAYLLQDAGLSKIEEVNLEGLSADDVSIWFALFCSQKKCWSLVLRMQWKGLVILAPSLIPLSTASAGC